MSDLDKMLNNFEDRKRREKEASEQERLKEKQLRERTIKVLREIVLPVFRELAVVIERRGHESIINESFENCVYPSVELQFKPKIKESDLFAFLSVSTLRFVHTESGQVEVKQEIRAKQEKLSRYDHVGVALPPEVDQEWVRSRVLAFVESVLKAN